METNKNSITIADQNTRNYFIIALVISVVLSAFELIPYFVFRTSIPFTSSTIIIIFLGLTTFLSFVSSFALNYAIQRPFSKTKKHRGYTIFLGFLSSFIVVSLFGLLYILPIRPFIEDFPLRMIFPKAFFASIISTIYTYIARLNFQKQVFELENEILKKENIKGQYEALKNELSPHFLFNSLNTLQSVIREDSQRAEKYVQHLSQVLRYTLQSADNKFVSLYEEIKLAESYIYLLKIRYEDNLNINVNIPQICQSLKILPLTLQSLIENAIKHNEISKRNPLTIEIKTEPDQNLSVTNSIQNKITEETSLGIGLLNLSQRYKLITGEDILISKKKNRFRVEIPLKN